MYNNLDYLSNGFWTPGHTLHTHRSHQVSFNLLRIKPLFRRGSKGTIFPRSSASIYICSNLLYKMGNYFLYTQ